MEATIESYIVMLGFLTFIIGLVVGIFMTKFADMWHASSLKQGPAGTTEESK